MKNFGIGTVLTLIFIILKLTGAITWGWFWVCFPLLLQFVLVILLTTLVIILADKK